MEMVEMKFSAEDVTRLGKAREDIEALKQFVLSRATLHARMTGSPVSYERGRNGFLFEVDEADLFNPQVVDIRIHVKDAHSGHDAGDRVVPRQFVFSPSEREMKYEQYLELKAEFEPASPRPVAPAKNLAVGDSNSLPGQLRRMQDVAGRRTEALASAGLSDDSGQFVKSRMNPTHPSRR